MSENYTDLLSFSEIHANHFSFFSNIKKKLIFNCPNNLYNRFSVRSQLFSCVFEANIHQADNNENRFCPRVQHSYNTFLTLIVCILNRIMIDSCAMKSMRSSLIFGLVRTIAVVCFSKPNSSKIYIQSMLHQDIERSRVTIEFAVEYVVDVEYICGPNRSFAIRTLGNCIFSISPKPTQPKSHVNTKFHGICVIISLRCKLIQM